MTKTLKYKVLEFINFEIEIQQILKVLYNKKIRK